MILLNDAEVARTRELIDEVEQRCENLRKQPGESTRARELTIWSYEKMIRQLRDDIARYESLHASKA